MNLIHTQIKIDGTQSELKFDRGNSHVGGKTSFVFESVFKSCKPSVQAFRFIKCLPVTFVHVKSSEVKLIKPNVVVLQI